MAKQSAKKLEINYVVIKCDTQAGPISLGILGTVKILRGLGMIFFVGNPPKNIKGLDPFEMKLVAAVPETVRQDVNSFVSQKITPDKLLDQISRNYRGTIFASQQIAKDVPAAITPATRPEQILCLISREVMRLAEAEKVASLTKRQRRRRRTKIAHTRPFKPTHRRVGLPQQFELTALHV